MPFGYANGGLSENFPKLQLSMRERSKSNSKQINQVSFLKSLMIGLTPTNLMARTLVNKIKEKD